MLRPVFDRRLRVLRRGTGGRYNLAVPGQEAVPCATGQQQNRFAGLGSGGGGRAETVVENVLLWDGAVTISENMRIQFTEKRVAGRWQALDPATEPLWIIVEGTAASPEVNGVVSHNEARIAREGG